MYFMPFMVENTMHESNSFAGIGLKITQIYSDLEAFWDKEAADLKAGGDHPHGF